jgi:hypothetical protein
MKSKFHLVDLAASERQTTAGGGLSFIEGLFL